MFKGFGAWVDSGLGLGPRLEALVAGAKQRVHHLEFSPHEPACLGSRV